MNRYSELVDHRTAAHTEQRDTTETSMKEARHDHLCVLRRIESGRQDIDAGRVISIEEVERRMARWLDE